MSQDSCSPDVQVGIKFKVRIKALKAKERVSKRKYYLSLIWVPQCKLIQNARKINISVIAVIKYNYWFSGLWQFTSGTSEYINEWRPVIGY